MSAKPGEDSSRSPDNIYFGGNAADDEERETPPPNPTVLSRVPSTLVTLGAGFLLTASIVAVLATVAFTYLSITGSFEGVLSETERISRNSTLLIVQFIVVSAILIVGAYFARQRNHWGTVMIACAIGSLPIITLPFTIPAFILLGIGKHHFLLSTNKDALAG